MQSAWTGRHTDASVSRRWSPAGSGLLASSWSSRTNPSAGNVSGDFRRTRILLIHLRGGYTVIQKQDPTVIAGVRHWGETVRVAFDWSRTSHQASQPA